MILTVSPFLDDCRVFEVFCGTSGEILNNEERRRLFMMRRTMGELKKDHYDLINSFETSDELDRRQGESHPIFRVICAFFSPH